MDQFNGELHGFNAGSFLTITLDANNADLVAGGNGEAGAIILKDEQGSEIARIGKITSPKVSPSIALVLKDGGGQGRISLNASNGDAVFGGNGVDGDVSVKNTEGHETIHLHGASAHIIAGGSGKTGTLDLKNVDGKTQFYLGSTGSLLVGGNGSDGDVFVLPKAADSSPLQATIHLNGDNGNIILKSGDQEQVVIDGSTGKITLRNSGQQRVLIDPTGGNIWLGGNGADGDLMLFKQGETATTDRTKASIHLNGDSGDIILRNADCAEEFDMAFGAAEPGTVMALDDEGRLAPSCAAYDKRVAGVVSGAGDYRPGIVLDRQNAPGPRAAIALTGKTYCKVDAQFGAIKPGDLLTTSPTPGHAMKASDPVRAFGAVIGKALRPLSGGTGLIPVLIALQ